MPKFQSLHNDQNIRPRRRQRQSATFRVMLEICSAKSESFSFGRQKARETDASLGIIVRMIGRGKEKMELEIRRDNICDASAFPNAANQNQCGLAKKRLRHSSIHTVWMKMEQRTKLAVSTSRILDQ